MTLELHTPCRNCPACRKAKVRLWRARAEAETRQSVRTWFGTLTLRPEAYYRLLSLCRAVEARQGVDFDALPEGERMALIHAQAAAEVTKMLKRLREPRPAGSLRHLCVLELHKSGVPHYHMLLHECDPLHPVRHADLEGQWPLGFSKWKLVNDVAQASYVAKYLSKTMLARVRASEHYGTGAQPSLDEVAPSTTKAAVSTTARRDGQPLQTPNDGVM